MAKVRINEWAKNNNRPSNEIVRKLKEKGHNVRTNTSVFEEDVLKDLFGSKQEKRHFDTGHKTEKRYNNRDNQDSNRGRYNNRDNHDGQRNQGGYNRDGQRNQGGYKRDGQRNQGGYNRDGQRNQGGYNRDGQRNQVGYNRDGQRNQGGYNRDGQRNQGGYNRDGQRNQGGYNRDGQRNQGGYNRDGQRNQGGYNRDGKRNQGGYNRDGQRNQGGYNRDGKRNQGGYNRDGQRNQGGYNRDGQRNQGGYNRDGKRNQGGYNRGNQQGGYNRGNQQGGYNRGNQQGGYNRGNQQGGYNRGGQGRFNNNRGPKSDVLEPTTSKPTNKKATNNRKRKPQQFDRFAMFDTKETKLKMDQKTKTQLKKEARHKREEEIKNQITQVKWADDMTVSKFAQLLEVPSVDLISKLFELGIMATINQPLDKESAEILCTDYNVEIIEDDTNLEYEFENLIPEYDEEKMVKRPAIVTIMGHVDHGKTTLLDTIRNANVTAKESGGITQHIGAYKIEHKQGAITFLDTPGHAAFTAMRARGADVTDITILVVAADDGVMPQTKEAISHAKDAKTPIIVAVNKMDKPDANPEKVMSKLAEYGVIAEEWGGETPFVKIAAMKGEGITELLDYIEVITEMHEYKAPANVPGYGTVIEANLDKGRGSVATILVQGGDVNVGDSLIIGHTWGSIRVMQDEYGKRHRHVSSSMPVEITGLKDVPQAGDQFLIMSDAKEAQTIGEKRSELKAQKDRHRANGMSLEELNAMIAEGEVKELPVVIKADVQGSVEALASSLEQIDINGVKVRIAHKGVGAINESDVMLASAGSAIMIGFNVRPDANARQLIEKENIDLMLSSIIYKIIEEIEDSMSGMREKKYREEIVGYARVDEVFKITGVGKVAGCVVTSGKISRECKVRLIRDGVVVYNGDLGQLKRFKDDVKEVVEGMDCGMSFKDFNDIKKGDEFEGYILEEESLD